MNKKIIKILLITLSSLYIIIKLITQGFLDKIIDIALEPNENIPFIIAVIIFLLGIFIDKSNKEIDNSQKVNSENEIKNQIRKYKILKIIGFIPFIIVICFGIFCSLFGFSFFFNTSYGLSAFFASIMIISLFFAWPFYIIGIILIIKSNKKIKNLKE